jgi:hypothetical protein
LDFLGGEDGEKEHQDEDREIVIDLPDAVDHRYVLELIVMVTTMIMVRFFRPT